MGDEKEKESGRGQSSGVRFSVCSVTDLLGFSSHLEIGGHDLRTAIGEQAIRRLENLDLAISLFLSEAAASADLIPSGLRMHRINDAVLCTMDLDEFLLPATGQTGFTGKSVVELAEHFEIESYGNSEDFAAAYDSRLQRAIRPVLGFVGIVARLHMFIRKRETRSVFPGARTVISTGFRRPFRSRGNEDDTFSANFALANAHAADKALKGAHFFVDNNIIELCSSDRFARNLMRFSCYEWIEAEYDCLREGPPRQGFSWRNATEVSRPHNLTLFRRDYVFRRLNASPLSYLQHVDIVRQCLETEPRLQHPNPYFEHVLSAIEFGVSDRRVQACDPPKSFLYGSTNDLEASITEFREMFVTGKSPSRIKRQRLEYLQREGHPELINNPEFMGEMDKLDEQTVDVDLEPVTPSEMGDAVWQLGAAELTAMLPLFRDDYSAFSFPAD